MTTTELLPVHPITGLTALAVLGDRPVWPVIGGAPDDDEDDDTGIDLTGSGKTSADKDDDDLDDEQDEDNEDTDKDADEWTPPTRDEVERMQKALAEANAEAKRNRLRLRELRRGQRTTEAKQGSGADDGADTARAVQEAAEAAERKFKPVAVRAAARAKFLEAGLDPEDKGAMSRLLRLVDMDEVDLDDDGDPVGLDEQIDDIKDDFPRLFEKPEPVEPAKPERRRSVPRINGANRDGKAPEPKTTGEKHMARLGMRR